MNFEWLFWNIFFFFFSSRRRHTRCLSDWSSDVALPIYLRLEFHSTTDTSSATLAAPPAIIDVRGTPDPRASGNVLFEVFAVGDLRSATSPVSVARAWVTYTLTTGAYPRRWDSVDLDHDPLDATRWFKSVPLSSLQSAAKLADIRFMAQATNTQGAVGLATNAGAFFTPHEPFVTVSAPKRATTLSLVNPPSSGTYRSGTGTLSARLSEDAGGDSQAAAGRSITFTIGSLRAYGTTDATGTATASLTLLALPGSYQLIASFDGD